MRQNLKRKWKWKECVWNWRMWRDKDLFTFANSKHTLLSDGFSRRTTFTQFIMPPSGPRNALWFSSETLAPYKSLTYLLTNLLTRRADKDGKWRKILCMDVDDIHAWANPAPETGKVFFIENNI